MILVIDNYDSFTYNLVQYIGLVRNDIRVERNDQISVDEIEALTPERIVISPGPGRPEDAGISIELVRQLGAGIPIMGVCLGHQVIAAAFGGRVVRAPEIVHGKTSAIAHQGDDLFHGLDTPFQATRYHSLIVEEDSLPEELTVTARTANNLIMGLRHKAYPLLGVQFHPESILTDQGPKIVANFLTRIS
ncbi:MAG: aminodeoxychorismate/anthranilate synthase component II [Candidatus Marinimicrobia bacterium]|nr:aminodeoxychorismate/anthranilate synthase component II [Candidatus Neomarinimicrobiota bacterium]